MSNKTPEKLRKEYLTAAIITGFIMLAFYFISSIFGGTLGILNILIVALFIMFLTKAIVYSNAVKNSQSAASAQMAIANAQKSVGKAGKIISSIALVLSILIPVITGLVISLSCNIRGATNESSCAEGWAVIFIAWYAIPCAIISFIFLIISSSTYSANKRKVEQLQQEAKSTSQVVNSNINNTQGGNNEENQRQTNS